MKILSLSSVNFVPTKKKLPYLELHEMIHLRTMAIYQNWLFDFVENRGYELYEPP
jgi:hypothetical protein